MSLQEEAPIGCPSCGETILVLVDCTLARQTYVEDCPVCCRPMVLDVACADGAVVAIDARPENE